MITALFSLLENGKLRLIFHCGVIEGKASEWLNNLGRGGASFLSPILHPLSKKIVFQTSLLSYENGKVTSRLHFDETTCFHEIAPILVR